LTGTRPARHFGRRIRVPTSPWNKSCLRCSGMRIDCRKDTPKRRACANLWDYWAAGRRALIIWNISLLIVFLVRGGQWSNGRYVGSLVAAIGDIIERHMIETGFLEPAEPLPRKARVQEAAGASITQLGPLCPKCSRPGLVREAGCLSWRRSLQSHSPFVAGYHLLVSGLGATLLDSSDHISWQLAGCLSQVSCSLSHIKPENLLQNQCQFVPEFRAARQLARP
jgi:hypothetical protein